MHFMDMQPLQDGPDVLDVLMLGAKLNEDVIKINKDPMAQHVPIITEAEGHHPS